MSPADLKPENGKRQTESDSETTRPLGAFHRFPFPDSRFPRNRHATLPFVKRFLPAALFAMAAAALLGATALLPARVDQVARSVEEVRGRRFARTVPASEMGEQELKKVLKSKLS